MIIVNFRTPALTVEAAESAVNEGATEVIVVDNASADGSIERLAGLPPPVRLITNEVNAGFGTAANVAARAATCEVLVFLNSDARFRDGALGSLVRAAGDSNPTLAGPRLVGSDGVVQRSAGLLPRPDDLVIRGLELQRLARYVRSFGPARRLISRSQIAQEYDLAIEASGTIDVSMVSGACMAIPRAAFLALGGFDEGYFMYFEDADLCRRAARAGVRVRYVPTAVVDHIGGASSRGDYRFGPWHAASMVRYLGAWHGRAGAATALLVLWLRVAGSPLAGREHCGRAVSALRHGLRAALTGATR